MDYQPRAPFNVSAQLLKPTLKKVKGVEKKIFVVDDEPFNCSFVTFGGTETTVNGLTVVENTAVVETWYDPRITSDCNIRVDGLDYEILGTPENINMRCQYMKFKVRAIKGGA